MPKIQTPRLTLRPVLSTDTAACFALYSDPAVLAAAGGDTPTDAAHMRRILNRLAQGNTDNTVRAMAICLNQNLIGTLLLTPALPFNRGRSEWTVEFALMPQYWRQGYMSEALGAVLAVMSRESPLRVKADVSMGNNAAIALLEKMGFALEGVQLKKGYWGEQYHDLYAYAFLSAHYQQIAAYDRATKRGNPP